MPKKTKKKKPIISTNEKIAREREKWLAEEEKYRKFERERDEKLRADAKKYLKRIFSGATNKAIRKRQKEYEKSMFPNRFIQRKIYGG